MLFLCLGGHFNRTPLRQLFFYNLFVKMKHETHERIRLIRFREMVLKNWPPGRGHSGNSSFVLRLVIVILLMYFSLCVCVCGGRDKLIRNKRINVHSSVSKWTKQHDLCNNKAISFEINGFYHIIEASIPNTNTYSIYEVCIVSLLSTIQNTTVWSWFSQNSRDHFGNFETESFERWDFLRIKKFF